MKLSIQAKDLNQAITQVSKAISARPTHPVLGCVLFNAHGSQVKLTGFDLSMGIEVAVPADVKEAGTIAIPSRLFADIVSKVSGVLMIETASNEYGSNVTTIKYDGGKMEMLCLDADDYPNLPSLDIEPLTIPTEALREGIKYTAFAASTDETKQILTGVHIKGKEKALEFAATDGHRLSKVIVAVEGTLEFEVTLPSRALKELDKLLSNESVIFKADDTQAVFESENTKLTCRVLGGTYPAYNQLLPQQFTRTAIVERRRLITALDRVGVFASDKNNLLAMALGESDLILTVSSQDIGNGKDTIPADVQGQPLDIGFNIAYLRAGLATMDCSEVRLNVNESNTPVVFEPIDSADYRYLVMPVQVVK